MNDRQATEATRASINEMASSLPMQDRQDLDDATRGFVGRSAQRRITTDDGQTQLGPTRHDRTPLNSEVRVILRFVV